MAMRGGYDEHRDKGWTDVDWFIRRKGRWRRFRERVEQVAWAGSEIVEALRTAGFHHIHSTDAIAFFRGNPRIRPGYRTFYMAQR